MIPREHRLRKHAEFEFVYRGGRRHFSPVLTAFYVLRQSALAERRGKLAADYSPPAGPRVGITVGRAMGKATARNRIRRRVRAAVTQNLDRITRPVEVVINPKKVALEIDFQQLCSEVARAFDVIEQKAGPALALEQQQQPQGQRRMARTEPLTARKK
jgi:ribonuclease P protein component